MFFFECECEFFAEFADAFRGGSDFALEFEVAEWCGEEFKELECESPVFLLSGERCGVGILFFGGPAQLMLGRGGSVDNAFELGGAVPCGGEISAGEVLQEIFFELLDVVVSFEESGADVVANEGFGDIGESGKCSDVVAIEFSEPFGLSVTHLNQPVQFGAGFTCGGVPGAEFFKSGECLMEELNAVFREGSMELFFELEHFVAVAGPELQSIVVAECFGDGAEQMHGTDVVVLLCGFAGFAMEFCDALVEELSKVCSGGLEQCDSRQAVGRLLQLV